MNYSIIKSLSVSVLLLISLFSFSQTTTMQVGSTTRTLYVYAPACLTENRPLLISMHGMGQDIDYQKNQAQWELVADTANFLVVYPAGVGNAWDISGTSDIDFLSAIIDKMYSTYKIDKNRVYLSGFSMGGMMTYHAMNNIADKIAAFAPVSGYPVAGAVFTSSRPIPIIHTNGDADDVVHYEAWSGTFNGMQQNQIGAEAMATNWAKSNGCDDTPEITMVNNCVTRRLWKNGDCGVEVCLNKIPGKGHWHSNDETCYHTTREIWKFVRRYTLDCGSSSSISLKISETSGLIAPAEISFSVDANVTGVSISKVEYFNGTEKIGTSTTAPYSFVWDNVAAGTYSLTAVATCNDGKQLTSEPQTVSVNVPQSPYKGVVLLIPGIVEAEDYDLGGEGFAFHDEDDKNEETTYRTDGVDVVSIPDGYAVGYTKVDEWLEYTVQVESSIAYKWYAVVSAGGAGSSFHLELDDKDITGNISVPEGADWDTYTTIEGETSVLSAGEHILKLVVDGAYFNVDKFIFVKDGIEFTSPVQSTNVYADSSFTVQWQSAVESEKSYTLNWVDAQNDSVTQIETGVPATSSYKSVVPASYEGATGYYTLTMQAGQLIPSDFDGQEHTVSNPIIWSDVPDPSIVRVGDTYYMVSTTMHMSPGVPVMASKDLVRWRTINYAHGTLIDNDAMNMNNGKNAYGKGSWASSIRYKDGTFYVLTPSYTSNKTHLYKTTDIENGPWTESVLPFYHDPSLLLDDDGRVYVVYGNTDISIVELTADGSNVKSGGLSKVLIANASSIAGSNFYVQSEGSHIEKINGEYYVFLISWPSTSCRTELVYRSATLTGSYTGKIGLQSDGVAQGGIFDTPDGDWYAMLFQDGGSVGRIPYLLPVTWSDGWPVFGTNGKVPSTLQMAAAQEDGFGLVVSDDFSSDKLLPEWQWNHNPDNSKWSLSAREGYMRLTSGRVDNAVVDAKNMLTQRSFGPICSASTVVETNGLKDGDYAGLVALQEKYGFVGVKVSGNSKSIVMVNASGDSPSEVKSIPLSQDKVWLRVDMDFTNRTDKANFYYSLDGTTWTAIGNTLSMTYALTHFMGYRFGLFVFSTKTAGGYADFDSFKIGKNVNSPIERQMGEKVVATSATVTILKKPDSTELTDWSNLQISVVPNPASEYVEVLGVEGLQSLELTDLFGKVLKRGNAENLSLDNVSDGVYLLRINAGNGAAIVKVSVKK